MNVDMLREMALFVEVAKTMSFRRAAQATGTPNSSLSRRIAALEEAVGARLFNRTTRSIELTEAGALYYARCRDIVDAARIAHEELADVVEKPQGRLRVSTTTEFARLYLGPLVVEYGSRCPAITLELDLSPHKVDLINDNFDLALRIGPQPDSGLISRRLGDVRTTLFASPRFLDRWGRPKHPGELARIPVIRNLNAPQPNTWVLSREGVRIEAQVHGPVVANSFGFMRQMGVLGVGVAMLHEPMVGPDLREGRLEQVLPEWVLQEAPVYALMPSRLVPAKTRIFLDMLSAHVSPKLGNGRAGTSGPALPPPLASFA